MAGRGCTSGLIQDLSVNADGYKARCGRESRSWTVQKSSKKPCHRASGFPFTTHWGSRRDVGTCAMARSARYACSPRAPLNACNATRRQQSAHTPARRPEHVHVCMEFVSAYWRTRACHHCDGHRRGRHERRLSSLCMRACISANALLTRPPSTPASLSMLRASFAHAVSHACQ